MVAITSPPAKASPSPTSGRCLTSAWSFPSGIFSTSDAAELDTCPDLPVRAGSETDGPGLGADGSGSEPAAA